uniref:Uncharacterized protein n=1 Tax=Tanacetum cinerariifolium TaxID=118510 RepID=A0A699L1G3_TANCI|nr:hypothetical protein [Tanacetum cinerariifolium]
MSPMTVPLSLQTLERARISRKSVLVLLEPWVRLGTGWVGFGVCPETCDPKLVTIDNVKECLELSKWNECLTVIDHADADIYDHSLNIWVMKYDGVAQSFTIMFHIEPMFSKYFEVFELRKNGEAIIETRCANNVDDDPILQVYDPCSGHVNDIRIPWSGHDDIGETESFFSITSYMETLLLLDQ